MNSYRLLLILICLLLWGTAKANEDQCTWHGHQLIEVNGESRSASNQLVHYKFLPSSMFLAQESIKYAGIIGDKIVVWYADLLSLPSYICAYDLGGNYEYGYEIRFSRGNGVTNFSFYDDDILLFLSSTKRIYRFSATGQTIRYYDANPTDFDVYTSPVIDSSFPQIHKRTDYSVDIIEKDGTITTVIDNPEPTRQSSIGILLLSCVSSVILCTAILMWRSRKTK